MNWVQINIRVNEDLDIWKFTYLHCGGKMKLERVCLKKDLNMWCAHQWHTRLQDCKPTFLFSLHLHETCYKWPIFYHKHCTQNEFGWICDTSIPTLLALSNNTWQSRHRCVYIPDVSSVNHSAYAPLSSPQYLTKKIKATRSIFC